MLPLGPEMYLKRVMFCSAFDAIYVSLESFDGRSMAFLSCPYLFISFPIQKFNSSSLIFALKIC